MKLRILIFILCGHVLLCFQHSPWRVQRKSIKTITDSTKLSMSTDLLKSSSTEEEILRKWFLLKNQTRCEVTLSKSTSIPDLITDVWKAILISYRVLKNDETNKKYTALYAFPKLDLQDVDMGSIQALEKNLNERIGGLRLLLQPEFQYSVSLDMPKSGSDTTSFPLGLPFILVINTESTKPELIGMDDIEKMLPKFESTLTNSIPSFPFPSVYDFVSEINRPNDPATLASLRFNFQVRDLKFDVEKMKKKNKNPQDYVDTINCRLTRLAKWRDVLSETEDGDMPDPFAGLNEAHEWGQRVRSSYQSLVVQARRDPKYALDNQYRKRATFIKIIDEWSLRLKQSFKFIYESKRLPPQDFMAPILASKWRAQVQQLTRLPAQVAFLDLEGPVFKPGDPKPLFNESRRVMWEQNYPVAPAMTEMLVWLRDIERVKQHSGGYVDDSSSRYKSFGHITQHVYSRSDTTEHLMFDCWTGLSAWLLEKKKDDKTKVFSADALLDLKPDAELDHTDTFKETLRRLNKFSRVSSGTRLQSVKDVFRSLFQTGKDIVDWWTRVVRDLDLVGEMDELSSDAYQPGSFLWTETMNGVVEQSLKVGESRGDSLDEKAAAAFAEANGAQWGDSYKSAMTDMEALRGLLPWATDDQVLDVEVKHSAAIRLLSRSKSLSDDAPLLHLQEPGGAEEAYESFLFVCPRYFRGIGITEELSAFLAVSSEIKETISGPHSLLNSGKRAIDVIPLHPMMVDETGVPDYSRRAPHASILFRISKK